MSNKSQQTSQKEYAYGADRVNGCECPATTVGFNTMNGAISRVSGRFDETLRDGFKGEEDDRGVVSNETARKQWQAAIKTARKQDHSKAVELAEKIHKRNWGE